MACNGKRYWATLSCDSGLGFDCPATQIVCEGGSVFFGCEAVVLAGETYECRVCFREVFGSTSVNSCDHVVTTGGETPDICGIPANCEDFGYFETDSECEETEQAASKHVAEYTEASRPFVGVVKAPKGGLACYECNPIPATCADFGLFEYTPTGLSVCSNNEVSVEHSYSSGDVAPNGFSVVGSLTCHSCEPDPCVECGGLSYEPSCPEGQEVVQFECGEGVACYSCAEPDPCADCGGLPYEPSCEDGYEVVQFECGEGVTCYSCAENTYPENP
jgi:hypothetical protein